MRRVVFAALLLFALLGERPAAQQRFSNQTAGISLLPPAGWNVVSVQNVMENRAKVRLPDRELQAGLQQATAPLFVFAKYAETHADLNPTVHIVLRPLPAAAGTPATTIMAATRQVLQKAYPDFKVIEPIAATKVSGMPAASMKATYTLTTQQGAYRILSRIWMVPRGSTMFLIGMVGPVDGPDVSESEFASALASIHIEP